MVPKVNSGANVYGVLQYNRIKVEAGEGRILYMQGIDGRFSIEECAEAFGYYTALNPRVRKPVVHFSLNPSPEDRLSEAQLTRLAAELWNAWDTVASPMSSFCTKTSHGDTCTSSR